MNLSKKILFLVLTTLLFSEENSIISQEIVETDAPETFLDKSIITLSDSNVITNETPSIQEDDINISKKDISFTDALQRAKDEHKIILLEIYENGCKYCAKMESDVFPQEKVVDEIKDNFILLKINGDEQELPLGLSIQMTPMHVFVSEDKDIKDMTFGFLGTDDFLELLEKEKN